MMRTITFHLLFTIMYVLSTGGFANFGGGGGAIATAGTAPTQTVTTQPNATSQQQQQQQQEQKDRYAALANLDSVFNR